VENPRRMVIAEDHEVIRQSLKTLISAKTNYQIVGEAANGLEAIRIVRELEPDLVLMDISMPKMNGLEAVVEIKSILPSTRIVILTVHKEEEFVLEAFRAGVDGYVLKHESQNELLMGLATALEGKRFISPMISEKVLVGFLQGARSLKELTSWDTLTSRERQVLKLIAEGHTNKEIAEHLFISVKTVETHRANLMRKLDLHSASELTAFAAKKGLIADF